MTNEIIQKGLNEIERSRKIRERKVREGECGENFKPTMREVRVIIENTFRYVLVAMLEPEEEKSDPIEIRPDEKYHKKDPLQEFYKKWRDEDMTFYHPGTSRTDVVKLLKWTYEAWNIIEKVCEERGDNGA